MAKEAIWMAKEARLCMIEGKEAKELGSSYMP